MAAILGCNIHGNVFKIGSTTGAGAMVGFSGFIGTNALARNSSGTFFAAGKTPLISIDSASGAGTFVATLQPIADIRGLAFSPQDTLFAVRDSGPAGGVNGPNHLVTINTTTGAVTFIGDTGMDGLQPIAFSPNGELFGWDVRTGLVKINPATAASVRIDNRPPGGRPRILALSFDPNGTLFGAGGPPDSSPSSLFTIDLTTGMETLVGSGNYPDVRGIAFFKETPHFPPILRLAWLWTILAGYILITPIGPLCILCGSPMSEPAVRVLGVITILVGVFGFFQSLRASRH